MRLDISLCKDRCPRDAEEVRSSPLQYLCTVIVILFFSSYRLHAGYWQLLQVAVQNLEHMRYRMHLVSKAHGSP